MASLQEAVKGDRVGSAPVRHHLLVLANSAWNLVNFRAGLMRGLEQQGYRLTAAAPADGTEHRLQVPFVPIRLQSDGLNPVVDAATLIGLVRLLREQRPDAVLSFTPKANIYGALAARILGVPALPNVSGLGTAFIRGGGLRQLLSVLYRTVFRRADAVFFQNSEDLGEFINQRLIRPEQGILIPGSGVDLLRFQPASPPEHAPFLKLLFVGRLLGDKGLRELAEAMRLVRQRGGKMLLTLVGPLGVANQSAISRRELEGWVSEGLLRWAGPTDDVRPFIAEADAVVLPSYREGLPRSLLEAAAMARPLIASDVPGNRELVRDGHNGLIFAARSAESLADALTRFAALSTDGRRRMGEAARRTVEQGYGEERVLAAYVDALGARLA